MALGILVDRDLGRVTYQVCLRGATGLFGFELQQLAELLQQHAQLGHEVLETRVGMPMDGALPYLTVTVNRLLPEDESWLQRRDQRMGPSHGVPEGEPHDSRTINETGAIARRIAALSSKERDALDEAVTALYFTDSSKYRGTLWSIIRRLLNLDVDEVNAFDPAVWAHAMNPEWEA